MISLLRLFFLLLNILVAFTSHADVIYFKNGKKITTSKIWADGNMVKCILYGGEVSFHPAKIERIEISQSGGSEKPAATSDRKKSDTASQARILAQEAYEIATSSPYGGSGRGKAQDVLERARVIDPEEAEIYLVEMIMVLQDGFHFGAWYRASSYSPGTAEKAARLAQKAVESDPQYGKGYALLAWMMIVEEKYADAESLLQKAYSLNRDSAYYWLYQGTLLMVTGRYSEARHAFDTAMTHSFSEVLTGIIKGRKRDLAKMSGDVEEALRLHREDIELNPESAYSWGNYGTYLVCLGRFDEAIPYLTKAVEISPYPLALQYLAFAKMESIEAAKCQNNEQI